MLFKFKSYCYCLRVFNNEMFSQYNSFAITLKRQTIFPKKHVHDAMCYIFHELSSLAI